MIGSQAQSKSSTHSTLLCGIREYIEEKENKEKAKENKMQIRAQHFSFSISRLNFPHLFEQKLKDDFKLYT